MRLILIAWACLALAACVAGPVGNREVPEPAKAVDLQRYLGRWYEFARYENAFEKDCEAVTADYALRPDGKVSVRNSCHEATVRGPLKVADGVAVRAGDRLGAKFKVSFFGPARVGATFFFEGRVLKFGRTISFAEADMKDENGKLLARLTTSCMVVDVEGPGLFADNKGKIE